MMISRYLNNTQIIISITLLVCITFAHAGLAVKNTGTSDKVATDTLSLQNTGSAQTGGKKPEGRVLYAEQWELTRSGESVLSLPVLNSLVNTWLKDKQKKIEIQYPGGEEGEFWVQQLADWLVALGIPSDQMIIVPGSGADDMIRFDLVR